MAQLIKWHHYPSRYEMNIYQYASRFTERKKRRYQAFKEKHGSFDSEEVIKERFYDEFFSGQLIWATSTSKMESILNETDRHDHFIKHLLRMFDDTALILYHPVFHLGEAEIDGDIIILTPLAVWCIRVVLGENESVFQGVNHHEWREITSNGPRTLTNPYIGLSQSIDTIQRIFQDHNMEATVKGGLFIPDSYVEYVNYGSPYEVIDRTKVKEWTNKINHHRSTLKHGQLRAAELLLKQTKTMASPRV